MTAAPDFTTSVVPEAAMLLALSHEMQNFKALFRGTVRRTFVLSPYLSGAFGLHFATRQATLGVPEAIYEHFIHIRWREAAVLPERPGLFLVFSPGDGRGEQPLALRLFLRSARTRALASYEALRLVPISPTGLQVEHARSGEFSLPLRRLSALDWEQ
ncbi:hypothetical protein J2T57_001340 [Natronocella acetinitrilica]|uniref:Uncharacterized protein n=1 Tax=Natronocella acetinitrilica TaxID=414046 RepID=A0AAE3KBX6_9GAMM|nr:hypothetical protein [Natronocella acetinitrilica]MCP1674238.1 hypothetical protein [Natronocella acetinitrilica]